MRQFVSITLTNLLAIPRRWGMSIVVIIGVAGVVTVLTSVMTMSFGLTEAAQKSAREGWAIVLRKGAFAETVSSIPRDNIVALESIPGIATGPDGEPAFERQYVTSIRQNRQGLDDVMGSVIVRGLSSRGMAELDDFELVEGRLFETGKRELVVGVLTRNEYQGVGLGDEVQHKGANWRIVGVFTADGSAMESEMLGDLDAVMAGMNSTAFSSVRVRLQDNVTIDAFNESLEADPRLKVEAKWEADYTNSSDTGQLIEVVAYTVSIIMAIGAVFGALNVMYMAVSSRTREIATLRALGFGAWTVAGSVLVEALVLACLGAVIGLLITTVLFQGSTFTTGQLASVSTVLRVSPEIATLGLAWGVAMGLLGGLLPAVRAVRMKIVDGLRSEA